MSIETEIASLTTAIRNLTDVLLASAAKALPALTPTPTVTVAAISTTTTWFAQSVGAPKKSSWTGWSAPYKT